MSENGNKAVKRSIYKSKKTAIVALLALIVLLAVAFFTVEHFLKIKTVTLEGVKYTVKPQDGVYSIYTQDGVELERTEDGYYALISGNLVSVNGETGEVKPYAVVDLTGTEKLTDDGRILMFPYISRSSVASIDVVNQYGEYGFYKDKNGTFRIRGYDTTGYNGENLSYLIACAGYTLSQRVDKEISLDRFGFSEYGFDDPQATYKISTLDGETHEVEIGDMTVDRSGYYARYVNDGRYALYILPTSYIAQSLLAPLEDYIFSVLTVKPTYNTYLDVQNCTLSHNIYNADGTVTRDVYPRFSYLSVVNGENRLEGEYKSQPFFGLSDFAMYTPSADSINEMLYNLYTMTFLGTRHLGTDDEALAKYGLDKPAYTLYFENDFTETSASAGYSKDVYLHQYVYFSEMTPHGTYYAYSEIYQSSSANGSYEKRDDYDQIVEIDASMLDFLKFSKSAWINQDYYFLYMQYCDEIKLESGDETITITVNHNQGGNVVTVENNKGKRFVLAPDSVSYVDKNGRVQTAAGSRELFEDFYEMLVFSTLIGEHGLTYAQETKYITDENLDLRVKVTTSSGRVMTYEYYGMSDLRSLLLMGVEGAPGSSGYIESTDFFVYADRTKKIWNDAKKLLLAAELFAEGDYEEYADIEIRSY